MPIGMAMTPAISDREQGQEEGRLGALGQGGEHRQVEEDRLAEIAAQQLAEEEHVLHGERLVEPEPRAQRRDVCRRGVGPEHDGGGIARRDAHDDEDDRRRR